MKDEIKEILDKLKDIHNFDYSEECDSYNNLIKKEYDIYLSKKEIDLLLDCITNLQQEKEDYKSRVEKAIEYIKEAIGNDDYFEDDIATDISEPTYDKYVNSSSLLNILQNGSDEE